MTETSSAAPAAAPAEQPLVAPSEMPKLKMPKEKMACINAFATAFAIFFGLNAIFAAIATFTKGKWDYHFPILGTVAAITGASVSTLLYGAIFTLIAGIVAIITLYKVTSVEQMKAAWGKVAAVMGVLTGIYVVNMLAYIIYSLMSLGRKTVDQGDLWLSGFLPTFIAAAIAALTLFFAIKIANGQTQMLRIAGIMAVVIAAVAFVLVFISLMVSWYSKKTTTYDSYLNGSSYQDILDSFYGE